MDLITQKYRFLSQNVENRVFLLGSYTENMGLVAQKCQFLLKNLVNNIFCVVFTPKM